MKVLVTGARGLLGSELVSAYRGRGAGVVACDHRALDVSDASGVSDRIGSEAPDLVLHCAAYTAVDRAESEPEQAFRTNVDGAQNVARACASTGARLVYFSTDFIFDGLSEIPYRTDDDPRPLSVYGRSKLGGEEAVADSGATWLTVRTSWLFGAAGANFVSTILERARNGAPLRIVDDQRGSPTWARHLAETTAELADIGVTGLVHVTNGGTATWYELARAALEMAEVEADLGPVSSDEWRAAAARPRNSVLDVTETEALLGRSMVPWPEALRAFLIGSLS
jgi:dTDP-4-dehydrorhamnose reductase